MLPSAYIYFFISIIFVILSIKAENEINMNKNINSINKNAEKAGCVL